MKQNNPTMGQRRKDHGMWQKGLSKSERLLEIEKKVEYPIKVKGHWRLGR